MKPVVYDKPRIVSTIILGILLLVVISVTLVCIPVTFEAVRQAASEAAEGTEDPAGGAVAGSAAAFALSIFVILAILAEGGVVVASGISLIFTIKNRKSTLKPIRIISYIMDGLFVAALITCLLKIILTLCGV